MSPQPLTFNFCSEVIITPNGNLLNALGHAKGSFPESCENEICLDSAYCCFSALVHEVSPCLKTA